MCTVSRAQAARVVRGWGVGMGLVGEEGSDSTFLPIAPRFRKEHCFFMFNVISSSYMIKNLLSGIVKLFHVAAILYSGL